MLKQATVFMETSWEKQASFSSLLCCSIQFGSQFPAGPRRLHS